MAEGGGLAHVRASLYERARPEEQAQRIRICEDEETLYRERDAVASFKIEAIAPDLALEALRGSVGRDVYYRCGVTVDVLRVILHRCSRDDVFRLQAIANVHDALEAGKAAAFSQRQKGHLRLFLQELDSAGEREASNERERLRREVRDAILKVKWPVAPDVWAGWDCVGETIRSVPADRGLEPVTIPAQQPPDPAAQQASWPVEAVEAVRLLKAELAKQNAQNRRWASREKEWASHEKKIVAKVNSDNAKVNSVIAQHCTATFVQCEVCDFKFSNLAQHQNKSKHGKLWEERQKETGSAKKRRLASARKESYHRKRLGVKLDKQLKPKHIKQQM